jgi:hypothetical protein
VIGHRTTNGSSAATTSVRVRLGLPADRDCAVDEPDVIVGNHAENFACRVGAIQVEDSAIFTLKQYLFDLLKNLGLVSGLGPRESRAMPGVGVGKEPFRG